MIYYTKKGEPSFVPQTEEDRFSIWVQKISEYKLITTNEVVKDRRGKPVRNEFGRLVYKKVEKAVGTGIAEPTAAELAQVHAKPCRYRRAARASRA